MNDTVNDFKVTDRKTFIEFLEILRLDLLENPETWECKTLPDFLESLNECAEGIQSCYSKFEPNENADIPSWKTFADIFKGAKIYE